jgi:AcrR family transcriptional regulator
MPSNSRKPPNPADRLLDTAAALFDREGIRAVGIDRLIADAGVARASLYQHFGSKDTLVENYLQRADQNDRAGYARAVLGLQNAPLDRIRAVFKLAEVSARRRGYRGCLYVNALTEFPDPRHSVRKIVTAHREWLAAELMTALSQAGVSRPAELAARIQLLYDGALVGSKATRSEQPIEQAARLVDELLELALSPPP